MESRPLQNGKGRDPHGPIEGHPGLEHLRNVVLHVWPPAGKVADGADAVLVLIADVGLLERLPVLFDQAVELVYPHRHQGGGGQFVDDLGQSVQFLDTRPLWEREEGTRFLFPAACLRRRWR